MKTLPTFFITILLIWGVSAFAMGTSAALPHDLESRIQAEVSDYVAKLSDQRGQELIDTADLITGSGLSDERLYTAVEAKLHLLFQEHRKDPKNKEVATELSVMVRALASIDPKSQTLVTELLHTSGSRGVRNRAKRLLPKLHWFAERNALMQRPDLYQPGQELMTYRYLNLINSDDLVMSRWGAEEMLRRGGAEPVVYQRIAEILEAERHAIKHDLHLDLMAWYCRILKEFDRDNSANLLRAIAKDPNTHKKLKKYAAL